MPVLRDARRLAEVEDLAILDTAPEVGFDALATLAAAVCRSPVAAINFVDDERHFTKAIAGMPDALGASIPNHLSFCAATVEEADGVLIVSDTHAEPRWQANPLVTGGPEVGFYAGASIISRGQRVGVVCVFGSKPRPVGDQERAGLAALAHQVASQLELRRQNTALRRLAVRDPLTGLANRTLLFDRLEHALAERARTSGRVGVLFCDVDGFKRVNDSYGHEAGDRALCDIAEHLLAVARQTDTVARIAGDEFVVICPELDDATGLQALADRLTAGTGRRRALPDGSAPPPLSVGAVLARDGEGPAELLRRADAAMYLVKADRGRPAPPAG